MNHQDGGQPPLTREEWLSHKARWCEQCTYLKPRLGCPIRDAMDKDVNDILATQIMQRLHRCSQFKKKEKPKKARKVDS